VSLDLDQREELDHLRFKKEQALKGGHRRRMSLPNIMKAMGEWDQPDNGSLGKANDFLQQRYEKQDAETQKADVPWHKVNSGYSEDGVRLSVSMQAIKRRNSLAVSRVPTEKVVDRSNPALLPRQKADSGIGGIYGKTNIHS